MLTEKSISVVINYYNPHQVSRIYSMLDFVLETLSANTAFPLEIILSDGSGLVSKRLVEKCAEKGWIYLHSLQKIGFAEAYNRGMEVATGDYRVWMASDILVVKGWEKKLIEELERTHAWMAAPYLTSSDYPGQTYNWVVKMVTFHPSAMTFNLNMITRECYEKVGLMDEQFSGCFNDIDYLIRIRGCGGDAIIADAGQVLHVSRATITESTMVDGGVDRERFLKKYADLTSSRPEMQYDYLSPVLCQSGTYRRLMRFCQLIPSKNFANRLSRLIMKFEPMFHRC